MSASGKLCEVLLPHGQVMESSTVLPSGDLNPPLAPLRERLSWALYDFANTVFSMNIATLYFSAWLIADLGYSNTLYATANGIASVLVIISIPLFGAISDATQRRKPWVVGFTLGSLQWTEAVRETCFRQGRRARRRGSLQLRDV